MSSKIRVAILDDHQSIIDGYLHRLGAAPEIEVVATASFGEELEPMLARRPTDVLLLDVQVPTAPDNPNSYPILHLIPRLLQTHPDLAILVISVHSTRALIRAVMEAGASGYVLKDDQATIRELDAVVRTVASGGIHLSKLAHELLLKRQPDEGDVLTQRQREALSLCAAYPDLPTTELAVRMGVTNSTVRNLLSGAYLRLGVHTRAAAIARARQLGLISPEPVSIGP